MNVTPETVVEGAAGRAAPGPADAREPRRAVIGPRVAGALMLLVGLGLFAEAVRDAAEDGLALGGPRLAPLVVTSGWVVAASVYCVQQLRSPHGGRFRISTPVLVVVALVSYALVLKYTVLGYVVATTIFFLAVARLLSVRPIREVLVRDVVVAVVLSLSIYLAFTRLLGLSLPAGVLPL